MDDDNVYRLPNRMSERYAVVECPYCGETGVIPTADGTLWCIECLEPWYLSNEPDDE